MAQTTQPAFPADHPVVGAVARPRKRHWRKTVLPWLFIAPIMLLHLVVVVGPSLASLYYSLTSWSGIGAAEFIGLENYRTILFEDLGYRSALRNNLIWLCFFMTIPFILALVTAGLSASVRRGGMWFRTILFMPYILPSVISASIWRFLLSRAWALVRN